MLTPQQVRQLPAAYRVTVPESYLDEMGHMNIQFYMKIFNDALPHFFPSLGITSEYFLSGEGGLVALKHFVHYLAEVHAGETVAVHVRLINRNAKRLHFIELMVNETTERVACTLEVLNSHFDLQARRTSPYPQRMTDLMDNYLAKHRALAWEPPLSGAITL